MKRDQLLAVPRAGFEPAGTRQAAGFYVTIPTCGALDTSEKARKATETPACKPNQLPNQSVLGWDIVATPDLPPWLTWEPTNALAYLTVISTLCRMSDRRSGVDVRRRTRGPWVYFITIDGVASVKIGTAQHLSSRLLALQACAPARLRLLAVTRLARPARRPVTASLDGVFCGRCSVLLETLHQRNETIAKLRKRLRLKGYRVRGEYAGDGGDGEFWPEDYADRKLAFLRPHPFARLPRAAPSSPRRGRAGRAMIARLTPINDAGRAVGR